MVFSLEKINSSTLLTKKKNVQKISSNIDSEIPKFIQELHKNEWTRIQILSM
jgi:hypothetical protein